MELSWWKLVALSPNYLMRSIPAILKAITNNIKCGKGGGGGRKCALLGGKVTDFCGAHFKFFLCCLKIKFYIYIYTYILSTKKFLVSIIMNI